ncbi:MAG: GHKL domain-containing protein [Bacteroidetes bacterium]|nr:GHKL domain-containing protein [Bacteroidota bacterium]
MDILIPLLIAALAGSVLFWLRARSLQRERQSLQQQLEEQRSATKRIRQQLLEQQSRLQLADQRLLDARDQLAEAGKLASLGQMTAGIAHEIKNPINFVNNFAESSVDITDELSDVLRKYESKPMEFSQHVTPLIEELIINARKIAEHGRRVDRIVQSMLLHSHNRPSEPEPTAVNDFVDQYVTLAFHGMRAQVQDFTVMLEKHYDDQAGVVDLVPQDMARVMLNLLNNAFQSVNDMRLKRRDAGYEPIVRIQTKRKGEQLEISVEDNGGGIDEDLREKIFEPFFTTKQAGVGTGLGLSLSHDIVVDEHAGELRCESVEGGGVRFIVLLPVRQRRVDRSGHNEQGSIMDFG